MITSAPSPLFSAFLRLCTGRRNPTQEEDRDILKLTLMTLGIALAAWLTVLLTPAAISLDTTVYYLEQGNGEFLHVLKTGRFMQALLLYLFPPLASTPAVTGLLLLAQLVLSFLLFVLLLSPSSRPGVHDYLAAAIGILFPYWQNLFYIIFAHVGFGFSILLPIIALAVLCCQRGPSSIAVVTILVTLSLGFYQTSLQVFFCILCMAAALRAIQGGDLRGHALFLLRGTGAAILGSILYLCLHKAVIYMNGLGELAPGPYSISFSFSLSRFLENIPLQLSGNAILLPFWQSTGLYLVGGVVFLALYRVVPFGRYIFIFCCLAGSLLANTGLALATPQGLAVRTTLGLAFFWSGMTLLTAFIPRRNIRRLLHATFTVFLLLFVFNTATSWRILNEISDWDRIQAMQIKRDILRFADARQLHAPYNVSIIGCIGEDELPWPQDWLSVTGYSMLSCFGSTTVGHHPYGLFQRIGAKDFDFRPVRASDFQRVQGRAPWPAKDGIFEDEEGLAIWLGPARRQKGLDEGLIALARSMGIRDDALLVGPGKPRPYNDWLLQESARNPQGPWRLPPDAETALFSIEKTEELPGDPRYVRVTGWVYDLRNCTRPDMIFFLDDQNRVTGFGHSGIRREELGSRIASRAVFGGFVGYNLKGRQIAGVAYFLDYSTLRSPNGTPLP